MNARLYMRLHRRHRSPYWATWLPRVIAKLDSWPAIATYIAASLAVVYAAFN